MNTTLAPQRAVVRVAFAARQLLQLVDTAANVLAARAYGDARSCSSIRDVPNRSLSIAKRCAKNVSSIGMKIKPTSPLLGCGR